LPRWRRTILFGKAAVLVVLVALSCMLSVPVRADAADI
jgi:hypothetical protein